MTLLVPHLDRTRAHAIVARLSGVPLTDVTRVLPDYPVEVTYSPVGGSRVTDEELADLRREVLTLAREHGLPDEPTRVSEFEGRCACLLHDRLPMTPHEASHEEVWSYLTCCWLMDVALWRFGADADERRFIGNVNRNTFRRMWWRAEVLGPDIDLNRLGEDELVSIMERPTIAGDRRLARSVAQQFLARVDRDEASERMQLMREAMKRLLRLTPFVAITSLSDEEVHGLVAATFDAAVAGLDGRSLEAATVRAAAAPDPSSVVTRLAPLVLTPTPAPDSPRVDVRRAEEIEAIGEVALDIARRTGRVTNMALREVASITAAEAREVFGLLVSRGALVRRGTRRGTNYVVPETPASSAAPGGELESALRRLLRRRG
jgi:hypothetical protein